MRFLRIYIYFILFFLIGCEKKTPSASEILGNPNYQAICYGGYRLKTRKEQPTIAQIKEDVRILSAMNIKMLRTYNVHLEQASNLLKAIRELKQENTDFEMYVMLGAWIDCENAWTDKTPNHNAESKQNIKEIKKTVTLAQKYPDIVKVIAVGNEAMVKWAEHYYVQPNIILKWVNHLQNLKKKGSLPKDLWITSSDDFASWGGGSKEYHTKDLEKLVKAVDYISMHTYPMHNTYYNPQFWILPEEDKNKENIEKINASVERAVTFAQNQYKAVSDYMRSLGVDKPIHIGESGWATMSNGHYGAKQSRAADEYKAGLYYKLMRKWTNKEKISLFYFEAFNEQWKDAQNPEGSENHFGLINLKGQAKYAIWDWVDKNVFKGLKRDEKPITKTFKGNKDSLLLRILPPPTEKEFKEHQP